MPETVAVRGDPSVLYRVRIAYEDGRTIEHINASVYSPDWRDVRVVTFDSSRVTTLRLFCLDVAHVGWSSVADAALRTTMGEDR
jgi:hypothetical protein